MAKANEIFLKQTKLISFLAVFVGSTIYAVGLHFFVNAIGAYAGGVTGVSQIIVNFCQIANIPMLSLGMLTIIMNLPIMIFGWYKVEKRFVLLSGFAVVYIGILLRLFELVPIQQFSDDLLVNILFGGLLLGAGGAIALRYGGSLGGMDIILAYFSNEKGISVGQYSIITNIVIVVLGFIIQPDNIESSLVTIILFFYTGLVVNQIHSKHKRYTAFIISQNPDVLIKQIHIRCGRGATLLHAMGSFSRREQQVIMTVISSYQLYMLKDIIMQYDPQAFVDVLPTKDVYGNFIRKKNEIPLK